MRYIFSFTDCKKDKVHLIFILQMFSHNKVRSTSETDIVKMRKGVSTDSSGLCKKV